MEGGGKDDCDNAREEKEVGRCDDENVGGRENILFLTKNLSFFRPMEIAKNLQLKK